MHRIPRPTESPSCKYFEFVLEYLQEVLIPTQPIGSSNLMALVKTFCMVVKDAHYTSAKSDVRKPDICGILALISPLLSCDTVMNIFLSKIEA